VLLVPNIWDKNSASIIKVKPCRTLKTGQAYFFMTFLITNWTPLFGISEHHNLAKKKTSKKEKRMKHHTQLSSW